MSTKRTSKRRTRARPKTVRREKRRAGPRPRRRRTPPKERPFNALMVFVMFLYMLRLISKKQFKRLQRDLSPQKQSQAKPRRRRR